ADSTSSRSWSREPAPTWRSFATRSADRSRARGAADPANLLKSLQISGAFVAEADLRYTFACPNCAGSFSIAIERIPPVRARFSCPKCGKPMDFPSREEARVYIRVQAQEEKRPP